MNMLPLERMYRYPDIPNLITLDALASHRDGEWLAELKYNGFRAMYEWDGRSLQIWGRKKRRLTEPSKAFRGETVDWMRTTCLPPCVIDGEWMGRRDQDQVAERAWLFDLLALDGEWLGNDAAEVRWFMLRRLVPSELLPACATERYRDFFEYSRTQPGCEGIVLKRLTSRFFGKVNGCYENPNWVKCKFRGGEDGNLPLC